MDYQELIDNAISASKMAYAPYSKFPVGACLLTTNNKTYTGCNFENSSFGLTICAERNAIGSAICDGEQKIKAIAIYSPNAEYCLPCGACRQVLYEFKSDDDIDVVTTGKEGIKITKLTTLFPEGFSL